MNKSEALKFKEEHDSEFLADDGQHMFRRGLQILEKYLDRVELYASYEEISVGHIDDKSDFQEGDILELIRLGFGISEQNDCFYYFT